MPSAFALAVVVLAFFGFVAVGIPPHMAAFLRAAAIFVDSQALAAGIKARPQAILFAIEVSSLQHLGAAWPIEREEAVFDRMAIRVEFFAPLLLPVRRCRAHRLRTVGAGR